MNNKRDGIYAHFTSHSNGELESLQTKYVDTGMGFERLVAVMQGKSSNYDTDLFMPIFDAISKVIPKSIANKGIARLNLFIISSIWWFRKQKSPHTVAFTIQTTQNMH